MIQPQEFHQFLTSRSVNFYCGVPDSLLKNFCAYITQNCPSENHIITANEGSAVGLATGHFLASGQIPLVYLQNSGLGNLVNPLLSISDPEVYSLPLILMIGWRGEMDQTGIQIKDEPQHKKQGKLTLPLLETLQIPFMELSAEKDYESELKDLIEMAKTESRAVAIVVRKNTFAVPELSKADETSDSNLELSREEAIEAVIDCLPGDTPIISTTGMISRELFELREKKGQSHETDFLTVGAMGHTSQIALGVALALKNKRVVCLDGDGSLIMHMGGLSNGADAPNLLHIVLNNGCHDSVGGQPTKGFEIQIPEIAAACGYKQVSQAHDAKEIRKILTEDSSEGARLLEIRVRKGNRKDLGRPTKPVQELRNEFCNFLQKLR